MPRVSWGLNKGTVKNFDREAQYKPYSGPVPPNGIYAWRVKLLEYQAGTKTKLPSLVAGLELVPRYKSEEKYAGYWIRNFMPVADHTQFRWVPFLDAIGVTENEFYERTVTGANGRIQRIGQWRNSGETLILAQLKEGQDQKGNPKKEIGGQWEYEDAKSEEDDEDFDTEDDDYDEEIDPDEYEDEDDDDFAFE